VLVIIFTCNHCPYAILAKPKLEYLNELYQDKGVQFVAINSNESDNYPEDSFDKMKETQYNYPFPYLVDESQKIAKNFGAVCTPDTFIYNNQRQLVYRGQLDSERPDDGKNLAQSDPNYVIDIRIALDALIADQPPDKIQKPSAGCSIKWR